MPIVNFPDRDSYTNQTDWDKALVVALQTAFAVGNTEVGGIREFRGSLPEGYLETNGSTFSADSFPDLFAKLGSNVLPNYTPAYGVGNKVGIKT